MMPSSVDFHLPGVLRMMPQHNKQYVQKAKSDEYRDCNGSSLMWLRCGGYLDYYNCD